MKISRLVIKNYRNIKDIDICLNNIVAIIGENNSGKSNLLKAITLPFLSDDLGYTGKTLSWADINNEVKSEYYDYILKNNENIKGESANIEEFSEILPKISVEVTLKPTDMELYFVKDLSYTVGKDYRIAYGLLYEFFPKNPAEILKQIVERHTEIA